MALDRARLKSIGKAVPGARQGWQALSRFRQAIRRRHWWKRWVERQPAEVVKSNTKKAYDWFFSQDEFIETMYLDQDRIEFFDKVAEYCSSVLPAANQELAAPRIIDVGCGTGHLLLALSRRLAGRAYLYGLDFSDSAIRRSRQLLPTAEYVLSSVYNISLPDDSFDMVVCTETLEHLLQPRAALEEMLRVLKPGGQLVLTVPDGGKDHWDGHVNFWTATEFLRLLLPYGLPHVVEWVPEAALVAHVTKCEKQSSLSGAAYGL